MGREWGIVGYVAIAIAASTVGHAQPPSERPIPRLDVAPDTPATATPVFPARPPSELRAHEQADARGSGSPRRMLLDGPADAPLVRSGSRASAGARFEPPRSTHDARFFPVFALLVLPIAYALVRVGENLLVTRRHHALDPETDVARRVSLAIDAGVRERIEARMEELADAARGPDDAGALERRFAGLLSALEGIAPATAYASLETAVDSQRNAAGAVERWSDELQERFRHPSTSDATASDEAPEGDGFVVLSLLVHATTQLPFPPTTLNRSTVPDLLASLVGDPGYLRSYRVVWTPADGEEPLTADELESIHKDLVKLDPELSLEQKTCRFCTARFAVDLVVCPTCGAPEENDEDPRASIEEFIHVEDVECKQCKAMFPSHRYQCPSCGANRFTVSGRPPPMDRASQPPPPMDRASERPPAPRSQPPPATKSQPPPSEG